jgi:hypothetical protein
MRNKANASAKSKEVQPHPQADPQLHHICFCPTAPDITTLEFLINKFFLKWRFYKKANQIIRFGVHQ